MQNQTGKTASGTQSAQQPAKKVDTNKKDSMTSPSRSDSSKIDSDDKLSSGSAGSPAQRK